MKKRKTIILALAMCLSIVLIGFVGCKKKPIQENGLFDYSDYQSKPPKDIFSAENSKLVKKIPSDNPLDAYRTALYNTGLTKQQANFIVTVTDIDGLTGGMMKNLTAQNRSTYMEIYSQIGSFSQIVSGMQKLSLGSLAVDHIVSQFGYCVQTANSNGFYFARNGSRPKLDIEDKPAFADAKWDTKPKDWTVNKHQTISPDPNYDPSKDPFKVQDIVTKKWTTFVEEPSFKNEDGILVGGRKLPYTPEGESMYQIDESTVDLSKSFIERDDDIYRVTLVFKDAPSEFGYKSIIDQACRFAGTALVSDTKNTPLKQANLEYTSLGYTVEIWRDSGILKSVERKEVLECDGSALGSEGRAQSSNYARQVYSYSNNDTDMKNFHWWTEEEFKEVTSGKSVKALKEESEKNDCI